MTREDVTAEAFRNPVAGMAFHEMYSFWVVVVHVQTTRVIVMEVSAPATLPDDGHVKVFTRDEFRTVYCYKTSSHHWVHLSDRRINVDGWFNHVRVSV